MSIIVNGFPKTGNHALKKGIELLGVSPVDLVHEAHPKAGGAGFKFDGRMVMPIRHPRNVLVSKCRWEGQPLASGSLMNLIRSYDGKPMVVGYRAFLPWRQDGRVLTVRYEDLVASDAALRQVAKFLDVPFLEDAFPHLPGLTISWTGAPSRWEDHWTDAVDGAWAAAGMLGLEQELGY